MDPNACLQLLLGAIALCDDDAVKEHATNLHDWLSHRGFEPALFEDPTIKLLVLHVIARGIQDKRVTELEARIDVAVRTLQGRT